MSRLPRQTGFTLLEIMVVIFIIGIVISTVSFNAFQGDQQAKIKEEAQRFQVLVDMASDYAVLNQKQLGIYVDLEESTYEFVSLQEDDLWLPLDGHKFFNKRSLPENVRLELNLEGLAWQDEDAFFDREIFDEELSIRDEGVQIGDEEDLPPPPPQIFILSSGDLTPFELIMNYQDYDSDQDPFYFAIQGQETTPLLLVGPEIR